MSLTISLQILPARVRPYALTAASAVKLELISAELLPKIIGPIFRYGRSGFD